MNDGHYSMGLPQTCPACLGRCLLFKGDCTLVVPLDFESCILGSLHDHLFDAATSASLAPGSRPASLLFSPHPSPPPPAPWRLPLQSSHPGHNLLLPRRDDLVIVNHCNHEPIKASLQTHMVLFGNQVDCLNVSHLPHQPAHSFFLSPSLLPPPQGDL